ncbi:MAG: PHP domain-containing protein [Termitinemataceae bacterium]|nr:MAG: PHP domain-containing protein [Termitinemataceae bacterium]
MIDLHTHSTASDGSFSPAALMREAAAKGLSAIALTDHDTIDGAEEAGNEAGKLGLRFIAGVEISIDWCPKNAADCAHSCSTSTSTAGDSGKAAGFEAKGAVPPAKNYEFHLLGLDITAPSPDFLLMMNELKVMRHIRNVKIIEKMREMGMDANFDHLQSISDGTRCIGRPHFAKYLVELNVVKTIQRAFDKFLKQGMPLYSQKESVSLQRALKCIKESGAKAILAHPSSLYVSWNRLPSILEGLKAQGLDGIEAYHPLLTKNGAQRMEALGKSLQMRITAGSDFHGSVRNDRKLGHTSSGLKIDDRFLAALDDV